MSNAVAGYGTLLKLGDGGGPETFTTIAEVKDVTGPGMEADTIESTNHSSPNGWKEYLAGMLDAGEVTFSVNFIPSDATQDDATGLIFVMKQRLKRNFQLLWPGPGANRLCAFPALVTGFEPTAPVDDALTADITLKVTGEPIFT